MHAAGKNHYAERCSLVGVIKSRDSAECEPKVQFIVVFGVVRNLERGSSMHRTSLSLVGGCEWLVSRSGAMLWIGCIVDEAWCGVC
jgi:hypothetical protein